MDRGNPLAKHFFLRKQSSLSLTLVWWQEKVDFLLDPYMCL